MKLKYQHCSLSLLSPEWQAGSSEQVTWQGGGMMGGGQLNGVTREVHKELNVRI